MVAVSFSSIVPTDPSDGLDKTQNQWVAEGTLTLTGNYGGASTHGDTLNFVNNRVKSELTPRRVEIFEVPTAGQLATIYSFLYGQGTTQANGVLIVRDGSGVEITEGAAYPAALLALTASGTGLLRFRAWFPAFL